MRLGFAFNNLFLLFARAAYTRRDGQIVSAANEEACGHGITQSSINLAGIETYAFRLDNLRGLRQSACQNSI